MRMRGCRALCHWLKLKDLRLTARRADRPRWAVAAMGRARGLSLGPACFFGGLRIGGFFWFFLCPFRGRFDCAAFHGLGGFAPCARGYSPLSLRDMEYCTRGQASECPQPPIAEGAKKRMACAGERILDVFGRISGVGVGGYDGALP